MQTVLEVLVESRAQAKALLAVLIDPGKMSIKRLHHILTIASVSPPDYFFIGGSTSERIDLETTLNEVKQFCPSIPVILFPGNETQISSQADALLLLSLVSGRNPELLIGKHVKAAKHLVQSGLEIIPTAYTLIDGGKTTTVAYLSQTQPIPREGIDIAASTALASELLGMKLVYLEAGSGARLPVPVELVHAVYATCSLPIVVGGGIDSVEKLHLAFDAGATLAVVGNALEENPELLHDLHEAVNVRRIRFNVN
jgi:putative glycerol-1-phosphate prenyltransferase